MSIFSGVEFSKSVARLTDLPQSYAEVAFVGRSNAGKSTVINALCNRHKLAHVSKTPGRTQNLNFFNIPFPKNATALRDTTPRYLVDLPGYGYARAPEEIRKSWDFLISPYLGTRQVLKGMISVMDCRHPFTSLDCTLLTWYRPKGFVHILLNKADKLSPTQQIKTLREAQTFLKILIPPQNQHRYTIQLFSGVKKIGIAELENKIKMAMDFF